MEAVLRAVDPADDVARAALRGFAAELAARFPDDGVPAVLAPGADEPYRPPRGLFVVAGPPGGGAVPLAGAGLTWLDAERAEVKRMWVCPAARGLGLGARLLAHLEERARAAGRTRTVLDTHSSLQEAVGLYRTRGYREVAAYNDNPHADLWFSKAL